MLTTVANTKAKPISALSRVCRAQNCCGRKFWEDRRARHNRGEGRGRDAAAAVAAPTAPLAPMAAHFCAPRPYFVAADAAGEATDAAEHVAGRMSCIPADDGKRDG